MKNFLLKALLVGAITAAASAILAPTSFAAFRNANDLIWDANASMGQVILVAKYKESPDNGLIDQSLEIEVKNVMPGANVNFSIGGTNVGSATVDAFGTARLDFDILGLTDDGTGRVLGPRGETGDMVRAFNGLNAIEAPLVLRP